MPKQRILPPQYELGDHIAIRPSKDAAIRPGEDVVSRVVHGKVRSLTWNSRTGDHVYGIVVPGLAGEEPKWTIVHENEIWGLVEGDADSTVSAMETK